MTNEHALTIVGAEVVDAAQAQAHAELTLATAKARAKVAATVIKDAKLYKSINGKNYVFHDGWTTLAAMYNLAVSIEWTRREEDGTVRARAILVNMQTGDPIGVAAESECGGPGDEMWANRTAMARGSMAQTRATSKVCRLGLSWVMVLGGFQGTPAEEMNGDTDGDSKVEAKSTKGPTVAQLRNQATELIQQAIKNEVMSHSQMVEWACGITEDSVVLKPAGDGILIYKAKWSATQAKEIIAVLIPKPDQPTTKIDGKEVNPTHEVQGTSPTRTVEDDVTNSDAGATTVPDTEGEPATPNAEPSTAMHTEAVDPNADPPPAGGSQIELPSTAHECPNCGKAVPGLPEGATCNDCIGKRAAAEGSE